MKMLVYSSYDLEDGLYQPMFYYFHNEEEAYVTLKKSIREMWFRNTDDKELYIPVHWFMTTKFVCVAEFDTGNGKFENVDDKVNYLVWDFVKQFAEEGDSDGSEA